MDEINVQCSSANQLQAPTVPSFLREMLCVNSEESEADDGAGNASNQIGDIFHAIDGQNCWPYDDSSE
jgi:hypothetical protein